MLWFWNFRVMYLSTCPLCIHLVEICGDELTFYIFNLFLAQACILCFVDLSHSSPSLLGHTVDLLKHKNSFFSSCFYEQIIAASVKAADTIICFSLLFFFSSFRVITFSTYIVPNLWCLYTKKMWFSLCLFGHITIQVANTIIWNTTFIHMHNRWSFVTC